MQKIVTPSKRLLTQGMLSLFLILTTCLLTACAQQSLPSDDTNISSPLGSNGTNTAEPFTHFRFIDQNNAWALTKKAVLRTIDGGNNWVNITYQGNGGSSMDDGADAVAAFQTNQRAWVFNPTSSQSGLDIGVWRTTDGGKTWNSSHIQDSEAIAIADRPTFVDALNGWLLVNLSAGAGSQGVHLYRTTDGGATWSIVAQAPGSLPLSGQKDGPTFENTTRGWISNTIGAASDSVLLYGSQDSGQTWNVYHLPTIPDLSDAYYQTTPPIFFGTTGIMPVHVTTPSGKWLAMYGSGNDGEHWSMNWTKEFDTENVYVVDEDHHWALDKGNLYATNNAGMKWSKIATLPTTASAMSFISSTEGWIIDSAAATLYHTTDGGKTWKNISYKFVSIS